MFIEQNMSPMEPTHPFIWKAEYKDGTYLTEFNDDKSENNFKDIKREEVERFCLIGRGVNVYHTVMDGIFNIAGNTVGFFIKLEDGTIINITDRENKPYNDVINYKGFYADKLPGVRQEVLQNILCEFLTGYKYNFDLEDDKKIYFQSLLSIPMGDTMGFIVSLSADIPIKGEFVLVRNGMNAVVVPFNLLANESLKERILFPL